MTDGKRRLSAVDPTQLTDRQRQVYDRIAGGPRGTVRGPFAVLLHHAEMAERVQALGTALRFEGMLPGRLRELAVLLTARHNNSTYEWRAHAPIAAREGLDQAVIDAIDQDRIPDFRAADEEAVYRFCREILADRRPGDEAYARAAGHLGPDALVELVTVCGYYTLLAMVLDNFDAALPDGDGSPGIED